MNKLIGVTVLSLSLGLAGAALAQGSGSGGSIGTLDAAGDANGTRSSTAAALSSSGVGNAMMGMKVQELIGRDVVNASGKDIGEIDDIVINDQDQAMYAVIGVGGFLGLGEKAIAIPFEQLRLGAANVILMSERGERELKQLPSYRKGQWKSVDPEHAVGDQ